MLGRVLAWLAGAIRDYRPLPGWHWKHGAARLLDGRFREVWVFVPDPPLASGRTFTVPLSQEGSPWTRSAN